MVDSAKHLPNGGIVSDLTNLFSLKTRRTKIFAYGFMFGFVACTAFLAFSPSASSSPWFNNFFTTASISNSTAPYRSQFSSFISYIFPNASLASPGGVGSRGNGVSADNQMGNVVGSQKDGFLGAKNRTEERIGLPVNGVSGKNQTETRVGSRENGVSKDNQMGKGVGSEKDGVLTGRNHSESGIGLRGSGFPARNQTEKRVGSKETGVLVKNQTEGGVGSKKGGVLEGKNEKETEKGVGSQEKGVLASKNQSERGVAANENGVSRNNQKEKNEVSVKNQTEKGVVSQKNGVLGKNQTVGGVAQVPKKSEQKDVMGAPRVSNFTASLMKRNGSTASSNGDGRKREEWINSMMGCDLFQGRWVKDESYPLYPEGSCPHIDEPFDCYHNGRPDRVYQKLRWQPDACNIPRLNATDMLERLRGKRLVFVGDSLNRNMWESLVCVLRNSVKDKSKVFEASGRREFRTVGSYSFLFKDYGCTVEFFRSPFLVQEWEMPSTNGTTKETLRLDIIERSSSKYKDAHVIVFNTGHWWTHEKTSKGKDYYQEGSHIYGELNVVEAFHKALNTWAKWVDTNVNPKKTLVFFRGYSASHFSGGRWNSGGQCDRETEPIKNEAYLASYPPKMGVLETVIKGMKTPVSYLNITRMTDYRKDAHPSIYRKQNLTEEEMRSPERYQDCSHWCLPGVPDSWNELLYAQLLIKQHQLLQ